MKENEIVIQFANTIKSLLMSLWYQNQIKSNGIKTNQNQSSLFL
jgi:hypothetical protein